MVALIDPTEKANKSSEDCCSQRGKIQQANQKTHENIFLHPGTELDNARACSDHFVKSRQFALKLCCCCFCNKLIVSGPFTILLVVGVCASVAEQYEFYGATGLLRAIC